MGLSKEIGGHCGRMGREARSVLRDVIQDRSPQVATSVSPYKERKRQISSPGEAFTHLANCECCHGKITRMQRINKMTTYKGDLETMLTAVKNTRIKQKETIYTSNSNNYEPLSPTQGDGWDDARRLGLYEDTITYFRDEQGLTPEEVVKMYI